MTGAGIAGVAGTTHVASSGRATAITAGAGIGGGAVSPGRSARKGVFAGAAPVAVSVLGLASALGLASGTIAAAVRRGVGARDTDGVGAGPLATGCSTRCLLQRLRDRRDRRLRGCDLRRNDYDAQIGRLDPSILPGEAEARKPSPWPPKVRLNSNA